VTLCDADIVVSGAEVEFGENFGFPEPIKQSLDAGKWVAVLNREVVERPVIHTKSEAAVLLLGEDNGSASGGLGWTDVTFLEVLLDEVVEGFKLNLRIAIDGSKRDLRVGL
jgi:hypothetical protein